MFSNLVGESKEGTGARERDTRPSFDVQKRLGVGLDGHLTVQGAEHPLLQESSVP